MRNKTQGKKHIDVNMVKLFGFSAALFAVCVLICVLHVVDLRTYFYEGAMARIDTQAQLGAQTLGKTFDKNMEVVNVQSFQLEHSGGLSHAVICDALEECDRTGRFANVYYVNTIGTVYHADGTLTQIGLEDYINIVGTTIDTGIYLKKGDKNLKDNRLAFLAPVAPAGFLRGYFVGVVSAEQLLNEVKDEYLEDYTFDYLLDYQGNIITSSYNELTEDRSNIIEFMLENSAEPAETDALIEGIRNVLEAQGFGQFFAELHGERVCISCASIKGTDWLFASCTYESIINASNRPMTIRSILACACVIFIMSCLVIIIWRRIRGDQNKIEELAYSDILTGAMNMNYFEIKAKELLESNKELSYSIICFDIVNFRYVNEGYGHEKADAILVAVANAAYESFSYNETFARISADKFVCLAINDGRSSARKAFVEDRVNRYANSIAMNYPIKIKSGTYVINDYYESILAMVDKADLARKTVTGEAKITNAYYEESLMEETRKREYIESQMEEALGSGEFVPYLQPKWDMIDNCVAGAEALVRWIKADGTIIYPNDFIPIFEKNGFVEKLDFFMLEEICKYIRGLLDEGKKVYPVSINQSRYLLHNRDYVKNVQNILLKYEIPKDYIELELTETVFFLERDYMISIMSKLKEINIMLSIDDFGSGFSSLNLLKDVPFDVLKIDRDFLDETGTSEANKWILRKIIEMADGLGMKIVCEGVETEEQALILQGLGCRIAQGYLYAKPMPLKEYMDKYNVKES